MTKIYNKIDYKTINLFPFFNGINVDKDQGSLSINDCVEQYNFDYNSGALIDGIGVSALKFRNSQLDVTRYKSITLPNDDILIGCWLFNYWDNTTSSYISYIIFYSVNGYFYYNILHSSSTSVTKINNLYFSSMPIVSQCKINNVDNLILVSKEDGMFIWSPNSTPVEIVGAPKISSMCIYNDRLFCITSGDRRTIYYSDDINPVNFNMNSSNAGKIEINDEFGKSNKIIAFGGSIFVFRDFNITKITEVVSSGNFNINQLYLSNGRIYENTVCVCGNAIYYLASDGIYSFNGNTATKIKMNIDKLFRYVGNNLATAVYADGNYYLACTLVYGNENSIGISNNSIIKLNVSTGEFSIFKGNNICDLFSIKDVYKGEVCVRSLANGVFSLGVLDNSGKYFSNKTEKVWKSPFCDFGSPNQTKIINEILLETAKDIEVKIYYDDKCRSINVLGKNKIQRIKPFVKGKKISFEIVSNENENHICNFQINVGVL